MAVRIASKKADQQIPRIHLCTITRDDSKILITRTAEEIVKSVLAMSLRTFHWGVYMAPRLDALSCKDEYIASKVRLLVSDRGA
jgi:hypothetical protein